MVDSARTTSRQFRASLPTNQRQSQFTSQQAWNSRMQRQNTREPPYLPATQRSVHKEVSPAHTLRDAPWRRRAYYGRSTRAVLDPATTKPGQSSTQRVLGVQEVPHQSSDYTSPGILARRQNQTRNRLRSDRGGFRRTDQVQEVIQSRRESLLNHLRLQPIQSCSPGTATQPRDSNLHCVLQEIHRPSRQTASHLFRQRQYLC